MAVRVLHRSGCILALLVRGASKPTKRGTCSSRLIPSLTTNILFLTTPTLSSSTPLALVSAVPFPVKSRNSFMVSRKISNRSGILSGSTSRAITAGHPPNSSSEKAMAQLALADCRVISKSGTECISTVLCSSLSFSISKTYCSTLATIYPTSFSCLPIRQPPGITSGWTMDYKPICARR